MPTNPKEGKLIYHITLIDNLENIIKHNLKPRSELVDFHNVADEEILSKRSKYNLEDFTPFHFFPSTPFSGSIQKSRNSANFVYLGLERTKAKALGCMIIPRHPLNYTGEPLSWDEGINIIDWKKMAERDYSDYECKEVCMAEVLFKGGVKITDFMSIFVKHEENKTFVEKLLTKHGIGGIYVNVSKFMFVQND